MEKIDWKTPAGHKITPDEMNNIVYLTCKYTISWPMRTADLMVIATMVNKDKTGPEAMDDLMDVTCEYIWDHLCGEPESPQPNDYKTHMVTMLNEFWEMPSEQRNEI